MERHKNYIANISRETIVKYFENLQRLLAAPTRKNVKGQKLTVESVKSVTANNDSSSYSYDYESVTDNNSDDELFEDVQEVVRQETDHFKPRFEKMKRKNVLALTRTSEGKASTSLSRLMRIKVACLSSSSSFSSSSCYIESALKIHYCSTLSVNTMKYPYYEYKRRKS